MAVLLLLFGVLFLAFFIPIVEIAVLVPTFPLLRLSIALDTDVFADFLGDAFGLLATVRGAGFRAAFSAADAAFRFAL